MRARTELSEGQLVFVLMDESGESVAIVKQTTTTTLKKFLKLVHDMLDD